MAVTGTEGILLLAARLLFGGVLAFMGLNHFMQPDGLTGYAEAKGIPAPRAMTYLSGLVLIVGGLAIAAGALPVLGAVLLAGFLLIAALTIHDFWAVPDDQAQEQLTHFLKNVALAAGALGFAAIGFQDWPYSIGLGLL